MSGRVVHFEVPFDDAERAAGFYRETFGWSIIPMPEMSYTIVSTGPTGDQGPTEPGYIGGGMAQRGGSISSPVITVDVDDIDKALAAVEGNGGSTVQGRTPVGEMGWAAYFTDSEGNVLGMWETKTA
jgi:predicted enzyme related to lactoylglutathione lyase